MDFAKILDEIILSDEVVENFHREYINNYDFKKWIDFHIPTVKDCAEQKQNNPWHKYNVLDHILHSVEAMNSQTRDMNLRERRILSYTMFFHDMGKPECHIERIKNGVMIDSFFNHNIASTRIAREVLPILRFKEQDIEIICKLVFKHDIFMFIRLHSTDNKHLRILNNDLIREEIEDLNSIGDGLYWLKKLVLVGRSDNLAQNEKMTAGSLRLLNEFDRMLDNWK